MRLWPWQWFGKGGDIPSASDFHQESHNERACRELNARFAVGELISYLGRDLIVAKVGQWRFDGYCGSFWSDVVCEYSDNRGVIREVTFGQQQLDLLERCKKSL